MGYLLGECCEKSVPLWCDVQDDGMGPLHLACAAGHAATVAALLSSGAASSALTVMPLYFGFLIHCAASERFPSSANQGYEASTSYCRRWLLDYTGRRWAALRCGSLWAPDTWPWSRPWSPTMGTLWTMCVRSVCRSRQPSGAALLRLTRGPLIVPWQGADRAEDEGEQGQ